MTSPNFAKISSMHFYAWKAGLKTGMYYLRTPAATEAIKFTVDMTKQNAPATAKVATPTPILSAVAANAIDQNKADMSCSLDNPDACEACGS